MTIRLFILQPSVSLKARVNAASFAYPLDSVAFDTVTTGTYSGVNMGETILFGTSEGADDLGRQRVRLFPTSDTLYFGRSSQGNRDGECDLADNCYITILRDHRVWSKTPHISSDGTIYKDSSIGYTDENEVPPPVANAGAGFCATIDPDDEVITVTFSAAGSFVTADGASIASYFWDVGDGTITVGTSASSTITATFPAGFRYVQLRVADDNANYHDTFVPVFARDPDDDDTISAFEIASHRITQTGQELSLRILENIPATTYPDGTLVMLWEDDPSGPTDRDHMLFIGWIQDERAIIDAQATGTLKDVVLNCVDVAGRLKALPGFPTILENVAEPSNWNEYLAPNMDTYMHYILQWHSTALDVADWVWSGTGDSYAFKVLSSEGQSLFDQVNRRAGALIPPYMLTTDTRGRMAVLPDPMLQPTADRTSTVQVSLDANDYSDLSYEYTRPPRTHWVRANSIIADSSSVLTAFSIAPGTAPGQGENAVDSGEHLCISQAGLNAYAGNLYARMNARESALRVTLAEGSLQGIEPSAMTWVQLTVPSTAAAQRGLVLTNARCLCTQADIRYQSTRTGLIKTVTLQLERETVGIPATTVIVEPAEPVNPTDPLIPPVITAPPSFDGGVTAGSDVIALIGDGGEIFRTANFTDATPTWTTYLDHITGFGGSVTVHSFVVDPFSPLYRTGSGAVNGFLATGGGVWKIEDIFGTASVTNLHVFDHSISFSGGRWRTIAASFGRYEAVESDNPWIMVSTNYAHNTSGIVGTQVIFSRDGGQTWQGEYAVGDDYETGIGSGQQMRPGLWLSPRTPGYAITYAKTATGSIVNASSWFTTDWGENWTAGAGLSTTYNLGGCIHVPWHNNVDEQVRYFGALFQNATLYSYYIYRRDSATSTTNITPNIGGHLYGLRGGLFGVRCYDSDRRYVVAVLFRNDVDDSEANDFVGVFYSSDYGNSWTQIVADIECDANQLWPLEAAFASDDPEVIYIFGNEAYVRLYDHGTVYNKRGALAPSGLERVVGLVGG